MRNTRGILTVVLATTLSGWAMGCGEAVEEAVEETVEEIDEVTGVDTPEGPGEAGPAPQRVVVGARSYGYEPSVITVVRDTPVWFVVVNQADIVHGFEVEGHGLEEEIAEIAPGATDSLMVTFDEPGEYTIYCPVGDHEERGMTGRLTVE
ncbi:MAG TPA: cupredoxin domain-containing protein [Gemmatimonadota bacterium]|nr:cupredoxin domain-containing protein [Gemmatimonadota bacterium]